MSDARIPVRVADIRPEAEDVLSFALEARGGSLPPPRPGAHIDVFIAPGLVRQYSLCNGPGPAARYVIAVKREAGGRGGSAAMHALAAGADLEIGAPRDNFPLAPGAVRHLFLAGGIGITPLLSMARHAAAAGAPFALHSFARSTGHAAFRRELGELSSGGEVVLRAGLDPRDTACALSAILAGGRADSHAYICGPPAFIACAQSLARAAGWPAGTVHVEHFGAVPGAAEGGGVFEVALARRGLTLTVAADESIVGALARYGIAAEVSCEQGICGTCLTPVLAGLPDHRDQFLTEDERAAGDRICLCVSRARSPRLVLDL